VPGERFCLRSIVSQRRTAGETESENATGTPDQHASDHHAADDGTLCARAQTLTVTLSANAVNFNLAAGSNNNPGSTSITATTVCNCVLRTVNVYAYFNNAASALTNAGNNIPSSAFQISNNGGAFSTAGEYRSVWRRQCRHPAFKFLYIFSWFRFDPQRHHELQH